MKEKSLPDYFESFFDFFLDLYQPDSAANFDYRIGF